LKRLQLVGRQGEHAVGGRLEVIEEPDPRSRNGSSQIRFVHFPREVRGDATPVHDGPRHAEAGRGDAGGRTLAQKTADDGLEALELGARQRGLPDEVKTADALEKSDRRFGPPNVTGENDAAT